MRDCPQCKKPVDGMSCPFCGYSEAGAKPAATRDPLHLICEYVTNGQRCAEYGSISPNLRGGGPWYCWNHYKQVTGGEQALKAVPPPKGFESLKAILGRKYHTLTEREPGQEG